MPEEFGRTTKNKTVTLPNGSTVLIPVVTKISFIDPIDRYQETEYTVDNGLQSTREVHIDQVTGSSSGGLPVERIDVWPVVDSVERGQETRLSLDNVTGADTTPPHFTTHIKTHVVRYINSPDNGTFIEAELIDEFSVVDPVQQGQETHYFINNPDPESGVVQAIAGDDDVTNDGGEGANVANPVRTDPFQNIIKWGSGAAQQYGWWYFQTGASAFQKPTATNTAMTLFEGANAGDLSKGNFIRGSLVFGHDPAHAPGPGGFATYRFLGEWSGADLTDQSVEPPPPPEGNATTPDQPWSTLGNFSMHIYDGGLGSGMTLVPQYDFPWSGFGLPTPPNQPGGTLTFNDEGASFAISALWVMSGADEYFFELELGTGSDLPGLVVTSLPRYRVFNNIFSGAGDGWEVIWGPFGPFPA